MDFEYWLHEHFDFIDVDEAFTPEEIDELFEIYDKEQTMLTMGLLLEA